MGVIWISTATISYGLLGFVVGLLLRKREKKHQMDQKEI